MRPSPIPALSGAFLALATAIAATAAMATASVGQTAPNFTLKDLDGRAVSLAAFRGKHVVLEWHNPGCPFVQKHYNSGNMQNLQNKYESGDTVWLTINSTHPGHQDYLDNGKMKAHLSAKKAAPDAYLTDTEGTVGLSYGAKATPHMYVINPTGVLVYAGAIDDKRGTDPAEIRSAKNYVVAALDESKAGKPVTVATSAPYGCSVKYK
ncbi:MAG TPA: thioredoxin family protein [Usitatibacteraceae bacterium]